jgi:hypothetical protein
MKLRKEVVVINSLQGLSVETLITPMGRVGVKHFG